MLGDGRGTLFFTAAPGPQNALAWHCRETTNPSHWGEGTGLSCSLLLTSIGTPVKEKLMGLEETAGSSLTLRELTFPGLGKRGAPRCWVAFQVICWAQMFSNELYDKSFTPEHRPCHSGPSSSLTFCAWPGASDIPFKPESQIATTARAVLLHLHRELGSVTLKLWPAGGGRSKLPPQLNLPLQLLINSTRYWARCNACVPGGLREMLLYPRALGEDCCSHCLPPLSLSHLRG